MDQGDGERGQVFGDKMMENLRSMAERIDPEAAMKFARALMGHDAQCAITPCSCAPRPPAEEPVADGAVEALTDALRTLTGHARHEARCGVVPCSCACGLRRAGAGAEMVMTAAATLADLAVRGAGLGVEARLAAEAHATAHALGLPPGSSSKEARQRAIALRFGEPSDDAAEADLMRSLPTDPVALRGALRKIYRRCLRAEREAMLARQHAHRISSLAGMERAELLELRRGGREIANQPAAEDGGSTGAAGAVGG